MLLLHYLGVFAPAASRTVFFTAHPLLEAGLARFMAAFETSGGLSVSLFFLISGTVLTYSFEAGGRSFATQVARRAVRLGIPSIGSILLAMLCFSILPDAHIKAAALMGGNPGMALTGPNHMELTGGNHIDIGAIANEIFLGSLIFGHDGATLLPHFAVRALGLLDLTHSFNAPLWTLHLEFYGSILVLTLVTLRKRLAPAWHSGLCAALVLVLFANPIGMFVIGYAAARTLRSAAWADHTQKPWFRGLAVLCLLAGFGALAQSAPGWMISAFNAYRNTINLPMQIDLLHAFGQYGAMLIFFGILVLRLPQRLLSSWPGRVLGRYSFSIYLVHFPILYTLAAGLFIVLRPFGMGPAIAGASLIGVGFIAGAIIIFERLVDQPAIVWSRRINFRRAEGSLDRSVPSHRPASDIK